LVFFCFCLFFKIYHFNICFVVLLLIHLKLM